MKKVGNNVKTVSKVIGIIGVIGCIAIAIFNFVLSDTYPYKEQSETYIGTGLIWLLIGSTLVVCFSYIIYAFGHLINCIEKSKVGDKGEEPPKQFSVGKANPPYTVTNNENKKNVLGYVSFITAVLGLNGPLFSIIGLILGAIVLVTNWSQIGENKSDLFKFKATASWGFYAIVFSILTFLLFLIFRR